MTIEACDLLAEWLKPLMKRFKHAATMTVDPARCDKSYSTYKSYSTLTIYSKNTWLGFSLIVDGATAGLIVPDSMAVKLGKEFTYDLHNPDSLPQIKSMVMRIMGEFMLTPQDTNVLVDMLVERLPMVWQDALAAIENGENIEVVLEDTYDGHVLRVLRKLGYDVDDWFKELREYVGAA